MTATNTSALSDIIADAAWEINFKNPDDCVTNNGTVAGCSFVTAFVSALGVADDASTFASLYPNSSDNSNLTFDSFNWGSNSSYADSFPELD
jgi:hypothetical protein